MIPVIALVGRPNVGKSTLFNRLTRSRDAIVDDQPGVTRDRLYGRGKIGGRPFLVVDTGGLESDDGPFRDQIARQVEQVIDEADVIVLVVDALEGLVNRDLEIADQLRQSGRRTLVAVNKSEGEAPELAAAEFQELALGIPLAVSARRGEGLEDMASSALDGLLESEEEDGDPRPRIALVGRPNVGKSTMINRLVGADRVIVSDIPGTTRDSVQVPLVYDGETYLVVDTAGVRRRAKVEEAVEKFSVIKTLQAIEDADVVLLVLDASSEIGGQDATIAGMIQDLGRSLVVAVNKWDRLSARQRRKIRDEIVRKLPFLPDPDILFVSALHGSGLGEVMPAVGNALRSAMVELGTAGLNRTLAAATVQTPPPMHHNRPVKLKFAHQAGKNPPVIVVHGNQAESLPAAYLRYLSRYFAEAYKLRGTRIRIIPRSAANPFARQGQSRVRGRGKLPRGRKS